MLEMEVSLPQHRIPPYCFIYDWLRSTGQEDGGPTRARKKIGTRCTPKWPFCTSLFCGHALKF